MIADLGTLNLDVVAHNWLPIAIALVPSEEPTAPDLHNATITQNGTLHCTFLNASDPASGYVCLPASARRVGP